MKTATAEKPPYIVYKELGERVPDMQFRNTAADIMDHGELSYPPQGEGAKRLSGVRLYYPADNGFPLMTERDLTNTLFGANGEIIGFTHGERTLEGLAKYGCPKVYWERWVAPEKCAQFGLEPGDLGDGSYGMQFGKPKCEGGEFSQIEAALALAADFLVGWVGNVTQYFWMGMVFAHLLGYTFVGLEYYIEDAHIYERQFEWVDKLFANPTKRFPTVTFKDPPDNYFAFRKEHLSLEDYGHGPKMIIPTPV